MSKQSIHKRLTAAFYHFTQRLVMISMARVYNLMGASLKQNGVLAPFNRVLLQDSTTVQLPEHLHEAFPGAENQTGKRQASMKVQTVFDLKHDCYEHVQISGFTRNDQAASPDILDRLQPGDLVIRDLGYFVLSVFSRIAQAGAYFLSRLPNGTTLIEASTQQSIDLFKLLTSRGEVDMDVFVGSNEKLRARLIARKVPPEVAAERRRKARKNRDKRLKNSKKKLALLDWEIFITNIPRSMCRADTVAQIYGFRWRIEILFKAWKSFLQFAELPHNVSATEVACLSFARIYNAIRFHTNVWSTVRYMLHTHGKHASFLKTMSLFSGSNGGKLLHMSRHNPDGLLDILIKHCSYEQRQRVSFAEIFEQYTSSAPADASIAFPPELCADTLLSGPRYVQT